MNRIFTLALCSAFTLLAHSAYSQGSGHALDFDGTSDHVGMNRQSLPNGLTFSCWIQTTNNGNLALYPGNAALNIIGDNTNDVYVGFGVHNGRVRFNSCGLFPCPSGWSNFDGATLVNDGQWHHIAATYATDGSISIYVDGLLDGTGNKPYDPSYVGYNRVAGGYLNGSGTGDLFAGQLDEIRIWGKVLTPTEIRENMCQKLTGNEADLVAYYRMDEGVDNSCSGGEDVCDLTGNGNHGTKF